MRKRYAAYDLDLLKYAGGVHTTRKAAHEAAELARLRHYEIREV